MTQGITGYCMMSQKLRSAILWRREKGGRGGRDRVGGRGGGGGGRGGGRGGGGEIGRGERGCHTAQQATHWQVEEHEVVVVGHCSSLPLLGHLGQIHLLQADVGEGDQIVIETVPLRSGWESEKDNLPPFRKQLQTLKRRAQGRKNLTFKIKMTRTSLLYFIWLHCHWETGDRGHVVMCWSCDNSALTTCLNMYLLFITWVRLDSSIFKTGS